MILELLGQPLADGKPVFGQTNGWSYNVGKLHRAVSLQR